LSIFDERHHIKPYEYPLLDEFATAIQHSYWLFSEFQYHQDIQDFKTQISDKERTIISRTQLLISQIEVSVKSFWGNIYHQLPKPEVMGMGAVFSESEKRHMDAYSNLLELMGLNTEFEKIYDYPVVINRHNHLKKYKEITSNGKKDKQAFLLSLILFTLFIENISLFSQFYIISCFNKRKGLFKAINNVIQATALEEQIHGLAGTYLINII
jgi:ribonucleoside-diphosphate reductase beta chain